MIECIPPAWLQRACASASLSPVTPAVAEALRQVQRSFGSSVSTWPDGQGGICVVIPDVEIGDGWTTPVTWIAFSINYLHPESDCYPHYVRPDLSRADGQPLAPPFHRDQTFVDEAAVMVSRASRRRNPAVDTPARKTQSVIDYMRSQR